MVIPEYFLWKYEIFRAKVNNWRQEKEVFRTVDNYKNNRNQDGKDLTVYQPYYIMYRKKSTRVKIDR